MWVEASREPHGADSNLGQMSTQKPVPWKMMPEPQKVMPRQRGRKRQRERRETNKIPPLLFSSSQSVGRGKRAGISKIIMTTSFQGHQVRLGCESEKFDIDHASVMPQEPYLI